MLKNRAVCHRLHVFGRSRSGLIVLVFVLVVIRIPIPILILILILISPTSIAAYMSFQSISSSSFTTQNQSFPCMPLQSKIRCYHHHHRKAHQISSLLGWRSRLESTVAHILLCRSCRMQTFCLHWTEMRRVCPCYHLGTCACICIQNVLLVFACDVFLTLHRVSEVTSEHAIRLGKTFV